MAKLRSPCFVCGGDGTTWRASQTGNICDNCAGTGWVAGPDLPILDTILDRLPTGVKLVYSYQIVSVVDPTEYAALVDAAKDGLRIILSCGILDLDHSGQIYTNLIAIFNSSPVTLAAIEAL